MRRYLALAALILLAACAGNPPAIGYDAEIRVGDAVIEAARALAGDGP